MSYEQEEKIIKSNHQEYRRLREVARELEALSRAFDRTGQRQLSDELGCLGADVRQVEETLDQNASEMGNIRYKDATAQMGNILETVLGRGEENG
jgi:hypothetical protein